MLATAATFFSGALAAWLLGTTRPARVIEILSLAAGVLGYVVAQRIRRQTAGLWTLIGYVAFWALAVLISICWILVAATGATNAA